MSRRGKKKIVLMIFGMAVFWLTCCFPVRADSQVEEDSEIEKKILEQFDFTEIDRNLAELFPKEKLDFADTVSALIHGDLEPSGKLFVQLVQDQISYEFRYNKTALAHILIISVFAAIFSNFSGAFQNKQISEISFYILYLLLLTICLNSFRLALEGVETHIQTLLEFMRILAPTYFLAVAAACGTTSSLVFYNIVLLLIYLVELIIMNILLPLVHIYIMVQVMNYLSKEDYLSQFTDLIRKIIIWSLKTLLGCIIGLNLVQGILSPAIDALQRSIVTRGAQSLPGIGNAIGGITDVVLGTVLVIKNSIGVAGAVICAAICAVPLIQMGIMALLYKLAAAVVQPVSDKRIVGCINSISEGAELLLKVIFTTAILFLITVAIVAASTS